MEMTDRTYQKQFAKFPAGDFSLDDAPQQSGRPAQVDSDQIETLTESNQCYSVTPHGRQLTYSKYPSQ